MTKFKVTWVEKHEVEIEAGDHEDAIDIALSTSGEDTLVETDEIEVEEMGVAEPDGMELAKQLNDGDIQ